MSDKLYNGMPWDPEYYPYFKIVKSYKPKSIDEMKHRCRMVLKDTNLDCEVLMNYLKNEFSNLKPLSEILKEKKELNQDNNEKKYSIKKIERSNKNEIGGIIDICIPTRYHQELADYVGVSRSQICSYSKNRSKPPLDKIRKIREWCFKNVDKLVNISDFEKDKTNDDKDEKPIMKNIAPSYNLEKLIEDEIAKETDVKKKADAYLSYQQGLYYKMQWMSIVEKNKLKTEA